MKLLKQFFKNYAIAIDQLVNTLLLGHPDETISSRLGRSMDKERYFWVKWLRLSVDSLFFFDYKICQDTGRKKGHCEISVMPLEQENFRTMVDYEIWNWTKE